MTRLADKIPVEPLSNERVNRVEGQILAGFRADTVGVQRRSMGWWAVPAIATAAAAIALFVLLRPNLDRKGGATPTRVVTPAGEGATLSVGDATIEFDGATAAEIYHDEVSGAVEVLLYVGRVECEVPPVPDRPPFAVVAGDVEVRVVGTLFAVERDGEVTVTVTRGKVSVSSDVGQTSVAAGESWSRTLASMAEERIPAWAMAAREARATIAAAVAATRAEVGTATETETETETEAESEPAPRRHAGAATKSKTKNKPRAEREDPEALARPTPGKPPSEKWREIRELEKDDVGDAIKAYQDALKGPDARYAAYRLAYVEYFVNKNATKAIRMAQYVEKRFPKKLMAKHAHWLRIYILYRQGKKAQVRAAARSYVRRYKTSPHRDAAVRLIDWY